MHFPVKATSTILFLRIKQVWRWLEFKIPPCSLNNGKSLNYPMYPRFCHEPPNLVLDIGTAEMLQVVGVWTNWNLKPLQQYQSTNNPERNPKRYTSHFCCAWCHDLKLESISIGSFLSLSLSLSCPLTDTFQRKMVGLYMFFWAVLDCWSYKQLHCFAPGQLSQFMLPPGPPLGCKNSPTLLGLTPNTTLHFLAILALLF